MGPHRAVIGHGPCRSANLWALAAERTGGCSGTCRSSRAAPCRTGLRRSSARPLGDLHRRCQGLGIPNRPGRVGREAAQVAGDQDRRGVGVGGPDQVLTTALRSATSMLSAPAWRRPPAPCRGSRQRRRLPRGRGSRSEHLGRARWWSRRAPRAAVGCEPARAPRRCSRGWGTDSRRPAAASPARADRSRRRGCRGSPRGGVGPRVGQRLIAVLCDGPSDDHPGGEQRPAGLAGPLHRHRGENLVVILMLRIIRNRGIRAHRVETCPRLHAHALRM